MKHVKTINKLILMTLFTCSCYSEEIKGIYIENDSRSGYIYKYDIDKNGKIDTIKKFFSNTMNIDGKNIDHQNIDYSADYTSTERIYIDIFYEIEMDNHKRYSFTLRQTKAFGASGISPGYTEDLYTLPRHKGFILGIGSDRQLVWDIHFGFNKDKSLVITTIETQGRWVGECTNYIKNPVLPKMIDMFQIENLKLKNCKKREEQ